MGEYSTKYDDNEKIDALKYLSRLLCLFIVVSMTACGDDDDDDDDNDDMMVDPLVATYTFTSATFAQATTVIIPNPADGTPVPAPFAVGDDAVLFVGDAIVGAAECNEGVEVGIELRENGTAFYVCNGAGTEVQQGSWEVNADRSEFKLTITTLTPPVDVIMPGFTLTSGVLRGTAGIPIPIDAFDLETTPLGTGTLSETAVALLAAAGVTAEVGDANIQVIPLEITFTQADF